MAGSAVTIQAQLADASGNPVATSGKTVTWSSTNGGTFASGTSTTNASGLATVQFTTSTTAGTVHTVTATDNTSLTGTSGNITTVAGAASKLAITSVNGGTNPTYGTNFSVVVQAQDANGNTANMSTNTGVSLSVKTGTGTLGGTTTGTISAGQSSATISGVTYSKAENNVVLTASGGSLSAGNSTAFTVNQAPLTVKVSASGTYGSSPNLSALAPTNTWLSYTGFVGSDNASNAVGGTLICSTTATNTSSVGSYPVSSCSGLTANNYTISYDSSSSYQVTKVALTVTASSASMAYGDTVPTITPSYSGFVNGETQSVLSGSPSCSTTATSSSPVGSYPSSCTQNTLAATDYSFTFVNGSVTVNRASTTTSVSLTSGTNPSTYGQSLTFTASVSQSSGSATPSGTVTFQDNGTTIAGCNTVAMSGGTAICTTSTVGAGNRSITAVYSGDSNYSGSTSSALNQTVNQAPLTVTLNPSVSYGSVLSLSGLGPSNSWIGYSGFVNGETSSVLGGTLSCSTAATTDGSGHVTSNVGTYGVSACSGVTSGNYQISYDYANSQVTVTKAALTVTLNPSVSYGSVLSLSGLGPSNSWIGYSGFVNGETSSVLGGTLSCSTATTTDGSGHVTSNVGTYSVSACSGLTAGNYQISYDYGHSLVSVTKAPLTVTADNQTRQYGAANPTLTATLSGFQNGQTLATSGVTGSASCTTTATSSSPVGSYTITCTQGSLAAGNYSFGPFVAGTLTVNTAPLTVTLNPSVTYGSVLSLSGLAPSNSWIGYSGFVNSQTSSVLGGSLSCSTSASTDGSGHVTSNVGSYNVSACSGLTSGNYQISYDYANSLVSVTPAPLTVTVSASGAYGITPTLSLTPTNAALTYSGFVNGNTSSVVSGTLICSTTATITSPVGSYPVSSCSGLSASNYTISYNPASSYQVTKATLAVTASSASMAYGDTVPTITPSYSGFKNGDTTSVLSGSPTCTTTATSTSPVGSYTSSCTLGTLAATNYTFTFVNGTVTVVKANTTTSVTSNINPSAYGQSVTFTATVSPISGTATVTGTVTFKDGSTAVYTGTLNSGSATYTTSTLGVGGHSITAVYNGNSNDNGSTSGTLTQTVNQASTTTTLNSSANPSVYGQTVTFTATVSPITATGTVTFTDGGTVLGTGSLSSGRATFATSALTVAPHSITATYGGDNNYITSTSAVLTQTVNRAASTTALNSSASSTVYGQSVTFTATVSAVAPGSGIPSGSVAFYDGSTLLGTLALSGGSATYMTSALTVATHSITATYSGGTNFNTSTSSTKTQTVGKASTTTTVVSSDSSSNYGESVTFTATVAAASPGSGTPSGTVTFTAGTTTLCSSAPLNSSGIATCPYTTTSTSWSNKTITAAYTPDTASSSNYNTSSGTTTQTVTSANTSTSLATSSQNPSVYGQTVTFTATVSVVAPGTGTPSGTVTFKDGGTTLGTGTLNASGTAAYTTTTSQLSVASHSITAVYGATTNFASSTSTVLTQIVNQASSSTSLASSVNPSVYGQTVTFTARVSAVAPGGGTPSGTVTFKDGSTTLGTGTLSGGSATYTTSTLTRGSHSITAVYGGSTSYITSTSSTVAQQVNQASTNTSVSLTSGTNPSACGLTVTFKGTASAAAPGSGTPSGTVTFYDGSTLLTAMTLSSGSASYATSTTTLGDGSHSITAVYGGDGNFKGSTSTALTEVVDCTPPTVAVTFPVTGSVQNALTWPGVISGTATDAGSGVKTIQVSIEDNATGLCFQNTSQGFVKTCTFYSNATLSGSSWSFTLPSSNLTGGHSYTVLVQTTDNAGNVQTTSSTFTYIGIAPAVTMTFPVSGTYQNATTWQNAISGIATADGAGLKNVTASIQDNAAAQCWKSNSSWGNPCPNYLNAITATVSGSSPLSWSWSYAFSSSNLVAGKSYTAQAQASDNAPTPNTQTISSTFTFISGPSTSLAVGTATGTYGGNATLSATLTSGGSALSGKTISFTLNGTQVGSATTNSSGVATLTGVSLFDNTAGTYINAGTYTGYVGALFLGDPNYATSSGSGNLTVNKAPLTVTASHDDITYGDVAPTSGYTLTYSGWVGNDASNAATLITGSGTCSVPSYSAGSPVRASGYNITCNVSGLSAANYSFTAASPAGTLTVDKATLLVTADSLSIYAGSTVPQIRPSYSGFVNTDTAPPALTGAPYCFTTATSDSPSGSYTSSCTQGTLAATNYDITYIDGTVVVI